MAGNRKKAEAFFLDMIGQLDLSGRNKTYYQELLSKMSDASFDKMMKSFRDGYIPHITIPNLDGVESITIENNFKIADKLGYDFHHQIIVEGDGDLPTYITPNKYLVVKLPVRRQAQHLYKKISIPESNNSVDDLTGQPTGKSKGSSVSYPEAQVLAAFDLKYSTIELMKWRGGDLGGFAAMNASIIGTGGVSQEAILDKATGVESAQTLSTLLKSMHVANTLVP